MAGWVGGDGGGGGEVVYERGRRGEGRGGWV